MKKRTIGISIALLLAVASTAAAQTVPKTLSLQGALTDPEGAPASGEWIVTARLFDVEAGQIPFHEETFTVEPANGIFGVTLGTDPGNPLPVVSFEDGEVWVANGGSNDVARVDCETGSASFCTVGPGPAGVIVDHANNVWVTLDGSDEVAKLDSDGTVIGTFPVGDDPAAMVVDLENRIRIACRGTHEVICLDKDGTVIDSCSIALPPTADPVSLAIDRDDRLWVLDGPQHQVRIYSLEGDVLGTGYVGSSPADLAIGVACPSTSVPGDPTPVSSTLALSITPNPVRTRAVLAFQLPSGVDEGRVVVHDAAGRIVREAALSGISREEWATWVWDCRDGGGRAVGSGVYFCRVSAGEESAIRKMVVVR